MHGPLDGIRVLDLSIMITAPYAVALLADQGAEVVKVERPGIGDMTRLMGVRVEGVSALYLACNRGKRSIVVDLQQPDGVEIVRRLAADVDVVVQNFRPGVLDRLGLGYDAVRKINPDVVYASISAFGSVGPYRERTAYDSVMQCYAGFASNQADPDDGVPVYIRQSVTDKLTSVFAFQAITAALFARVRGAGGQHVEVSMMDAAVSFLWADAAGNEMLDDADGSLPSSPVAGLAPVPFADGWGAINAITPEDWTGVCRALGAPELADRLVTSLEDRITHRDRANDAVDMWHALAANMPRAEAAERLAAEHVPFSMALHPAELADDPHASAVGLFEEFDHPVAGHGRLPRHPARFGETPAAPVGLAPDLGQHTDEILDELGLAAETADLRARGVVA